MSDLTIRPAQPTQEDVSAIYDLLLRMFEEASLQALSPQKAMVEIARVCGEEAAWIVEREGEVVASIGLAQSGYWYTDDAVLHTRWLYSMPEYRGGPKNAFGLMMDEVRALATATGMVAWIDVFNPLKTKRRDGRIDAAFRRYSFDPRGARMRLAPVEEQEAA